MDYPDESKRVDKWLTDNGFSASIQILKVTAKTAQDAANALGCDLGKIAKSIIFYKVETGEPVLVVASGRNRVDKDKVGKYLGTKIKTAGPEYALEKTGYNVGGIPPVAHKEKILTIIDADLFQFDTIWAAAGHPNSLFPINPEMLLELSGGEKALIY